MVTLLVWCIWYHVLSHNHEVLLAKHNLEWPITLWDRLYAYHVHSVTANSGYTYKNTVAHFPDANTAHQVVWFLTGGNLLGTHKSYCWSKSIYPLIRFSKWEGDLHMETCVEESLGWQRTGDKAEHAPAYASIDWLRILSYLSVAFFDV